MKVSKLVEGKNIYKTAIAVIIIGLLSIPLITEVRIELGQSFLAPKWGGYDVYYKGKFIASTGGMTSILHNDDFSEITINSLIPKTFINGVEKEHRN